MTGGRGGLCHKSRAGGRGPIYAAGAGTATVRCRF